MQATAAASFLHQAAYHGLVEVAQSLLGEQKKSPDVRNEHGQTPLMWAARRQQIKMAALLLQAGADINCVDHSGSSALHHACSLQHNDMVRFLIANKADVSLVDADGLSPIQLAREETLLVFMQAILTLKQQSDGTVGAKAEAPPGSPGKRRSSVLTPTKASMARSPSKEGPSPGPDDPDKTEVAKDRLDQMSQFLRNQEHIPLNVYDGCDARSGDLYLCVEHCYDCACHGMSLRHDQQKYLQLSNCILFELVQTVLKMKRNFPFVKRVFAFRVKPTAPNRLGALEVTAAFKTRVRRRPTNKLDLIRSISSTPLKETWLSQRLHSKLSNLNWPRAEQCREALGIFLWGLHSLGLDGNAGMEDSPTKEHIIMASHNEKLDLWQQRVGIDDSTPAVSRVRSAHKISTTSAGTSKVAEPRGFLTLLSSSWGGGGADVDDEIEETTDGFGMFGYVANIRKSVPIYDTNYYLVFEREAGQDTASDFG